MAGVAADMRAGEAELLAQEVDEQHARLGQAFDGAAVDGHLDVHLGHDRSSLRRRGSRAASMARRTMTPGDLGAEFGRPASVGGGPRDRLGRLDRGVDRGLVERRADERGAGASAHRAACRRHW